MCVCVWGGGGSLLSLYSSQILHIPMITCNSLVKQSSEWVVGDTIIWTPRPAPLHNPMDFIGLHDWTFEHSVWFISLMVAVFHKESKEIIIKIKTNH